MWYAERLPRSASGEKWKGLRLGWLLVDCGQMISKVLLPLVMFFQDGNDFIPINSWLKLFSSLDLDYRSVQYIRTPQE